MVIETAGNKLYLFIETSSTKLICRQMAKAISFLSRVKNAGASGRFIAIFSIFSLSFLGGRFKFTTDGLKRYLDVSRLLRDEYAKRFEETFDCILTYTLLTFSG